VIALAGTIWAGVSYFNPIGTVDLTVWIQDSVPVSLPPHTPLELSYANEKISRAVVMRLSVTNTGRAPLGGDAPAERWTLTLKPVAGGKLVTLGTPLAHPENVVFDVSQSAPAAESLDVNVGLLNPSDSISLRVLLINPSDVEKAGLTAHTRIRGLRAPHVTREPLGERIRSAYFGPVWVVAFVLMMVVTVRVDIKKRSLDVWNVLSDVAISTFIGLFGAIAISWLLARLLLFQLAR
jgi:hypothetical protein